MIKKDGNRMKLGTMRGNSSRLGKAVEHLVAVSCILGSNGQLNVSTSLVDDEGVDLVFHRSGGGPTLSVQVKSRATGATVLQRGGFMAFLRMKTLKPRPDLYVLFVAVELGRAALETIWFVPSEEFARSGRPTTKGRIRFVASMNPASRDRWSRCKVAPGDLPTRIIEVIDGLEGSSSSR